jgi:hypothetical protein
MKPKSIIINFTVLLDQHKQKIFDEILYKFVPFITSKETAEF